jgi:hypothetical protein
MCTKISYFSNKKKYGDYGEQFSLEDQRGGPGGGDANATAWLTVGVTTTCRLACSPFPLPSSFYG